VLSDKGGEVTDKVADHWLACEAEEGVAFLGGVVGLVHEGYVMSDRAVVELLPKHTAQSHAAGLVRDAVADHRPIANLRAPRRHEGAQSVGLSSGERRLEGDGKAPVITGPLLVAAWPESEPLELDNVSVDLLRLRPRDPEAMEAIITERFDVEVTRPERPLGVGDRRGGKGAA
jgi:hypothetical protein